VTGIGLVMAGIAIHRPPAEPGRDPRTLPSSVEENVETWT
jgi:hypothetical protein